MSYQTIYCFPGSVNEKSTQIPNICPQCGVVVHFEEAAYYQWENTEGSLRNAVLLLCPHCRHIICVEFNEVGPTGIYPQRRTFPMEEEIREAYPRFAKIYQQSLVAEALGLDELAGMGMRKSIEALIKQFASELTPDKKEKIERETLKQVIDQIQIQDIHLLGLVNAYLGNDFTHLVPKNPGYTLEDLKKFIEVLQYYILMHRRLVAAKAVISSQKTTDHPST